MKANEICDYLEQFFPLHLQEEWDTCGLQIGSTNQDINKVMIGLNADEETLDLAIASNCNMLITHHPFLLERIRNYDTNKMHGRFIKKALTNNIMVYSLHTCLDRGQNGISMNDWLINTLNVTDVKNYDSVGIGKMGILKKPMETEKFLNEVSNAFSAKNVRYNRNVNKLIQRVAICGGSGADDIEYLCEQVDCFITGDTKHRHMKLAMDNDILLIDIGHHAEVIIEEKVKELLKSLPLEVVIANSEDYYIYK
ncbi:MAG: Nif3-like dinuclear metal center hexameric protein [Coprobacillaceae bacterium]